MNENKQKAVNSFGSIGFALALIALGLFWLKDVGSVLVGLAVTFSSLVSLRSLVV